jgi:RHS repeat-associated protein
MSPSTVALYGDGTWAFTNATLADGNNSYTAIATDGYLRKDTNTVSVNLPLSSSYRYDLNGNLLSDGRRGFDYDIENQLIRVTITNSTRSDFAYDGKMRRRVRVECSWVSGAWVTNEIVRYVYDGNLVVQERHFVPQPVGEVLQQVISYTRGKDLSGGLEGAGGIGGLLARSDLSTLNFQPSTSHAYYHADGNGNVTCLIDKNQVVVAKYLYEPFGNIVSQTGPMSDANVYRFSSKEWHQPSGLVNYLYRYYEPNLQRWVNRDPLGELGGVNLFTLTDNNPLNRYDPEGLLVGTTPPRVMPPFVGPLVVIGPIGNAITIGAAGATLIDAAALLFWPDPGSDPLPLKRGPSACAQRGKGNVSYDEILNEAYKNPAARKDKDKLCEELRDLMDKYRKEGNTSMYEKAKSTFKDKCRGWRG